MCGVVGVLEARGPGSGRRLEPIVWGMVETLLHRGPDDIGFWSDESHGLALGHSRLSVVDLTEAGSQPMSSSDGRWTIAYNGELYNTDELRQRLGRPAIGGFRGHSDTEILVEAIAKWDFPMAVSRANGMFALAAWDSKYQQLWLARDRFGEKPLYYAVHQGSVLFASELKP